MPAGTYSVSAMDGSDRLVCGCVDGSPKRTLVSSTESAVKTAGQGAMTMPKPDLIRLASSNVEAYNAANWQRLSELLAPMSSTTSPERNAA